MSKGSVYLKIPIIGRVITIWDKLLFKIRVSFYVLLNRNKVLLESICRIETHVDVVVEASEVQSSFSFDLCID